MIACGPLELRTHLVRDSCGTESSAVVIRPDRLQRASSGRGGQINQLRTSNRFRNAEVEGSIPFCSTTSYSEIRFDSDCWRVAP